MAQNEHSSSGSVSCALCIHDAYLSGPPDPDENDFRSTGIRFTHHQEGERSSEYPTRGRSPAPLNLPTYTVRTRDASRVVDDFDHTIAALNSRQGPPNLSGLNAHQPSDYVDLTGGLCMYSDSHQQNRGQDLSAPLGAIESPMSRTTSPNMFTTPSEAQLALHDALNSSQGGHLTPLITEARTCSPSGRGPLDPYRSKARSPIVKVESYSRGDSPVRDSYLPAFPRSWSPAHLSPGNINEVFSELEVDGREAESDNSVSLLNDDPLARNFGVDPLSRTDTYVPSPNDMIAQRQLDHKNESIRSWSASVSAANSDFGDEEPGLLSHPCPTGMRRRAASAGDLPLQQSYSNFRFPVVSGSNTAGLGILVHENYSEDSDVKERKVGIRSISPRVSIDQARFRKTTSETEETSIGRWHLDRSRQSQTQGSTSEVVWTQSQTSNAAISAFNERARDFETASRVATWGTGGLSQSFDNMLIDENKDKGKERRPSLLASAANNLKRQLSHIYTIHSHEDACAGGGDASRSRKKNSSPLRGKLSVGNVRRFHQKSSSLNTHDAVVAISGQMAAIANKGTVITVPPRSGGSTQSAPRKSRPRSISEILERPVPRPVELASAQIQEPLAIPLFPVKFTGREHTQTESGAGHDTRPNSCDNEGVSGSDELAMESPLASRLPIPTLEGFKIQVTRLNPQLQPCLIDRFAREQFRRYKTLVEQKSSHFIAISQNKCMSGKYCFACSSNNTLPPLLSSPQGAEFVPTQLQDIEDDEKTFGGGVVTPAQFPNGVPLPPVARLPAEFECPVCFEVRKFQKPSDWTKHVYEDIQPFTCTFTDCTEPKTFKRKADWVRHEGEQHRKLEWWTCVIDDCQHTCYRKNNFVQHLAREHKMAEPGTKRPMEQESHREYELEQLLVLVERCRHDTSRSATDEPCRFCGNVCSTWKKLEVHLAKHLEQIALPVLQLVNERDFPFS